ncbi:MAG: hypothetical protein QOF63_4317 [Thermoanaerobaculia bacterium]|jgi:hypothetical protein|nr:hypothetical protein [Thermoanaerobaculia bacterium]
MKAAVSIPDRVFETRHLGLSRSSLFTLALHRFIEERDEDAITAKINDVYATESSIIDPIFQSIQSRSVKN